MPIDSKEAFNCFEKEAEQQKPVSLLRNWRMDLGPTLICLLDFIDINVSCGGGSHDLLYFGQATLKAFVVKWQESEAWLMCTFIDL